MEQSPLYAAVDLGSNSFHLLIVRKVAGQVRIVSRVKRKVRLASGLDSNNNLSSDAMKRGLDCIRLFAEQLQDVAAENIRIVGTATLRLAANRDYFVEQAERILKHRVEVISGKREASLIYLGVSVTSSGTGSRLVIDIGGASTEIVLGHGYDVSVVNSLPMGCVLWQSRFFGDGIVDSDRFSRAVGAAEEIVRTVAEQYKGYSWELCSGASGTIQALQEIIIAGGGVSARSSYEAHRQVYKGRLHLKYRYPRPGSRKKAGVPVGALHPYGALQGARHQEHDPLGRRAPRGTYRRDGRLRAEG